MSISTQITVVATAEQIIITAPGALRGPQGIPGPMGDVTPEVTQLVEDAQAAASEATAAKDSAQQSATLSEGFKVEAEAAAETATEQLGSITEQARIATEAASESLTASEQAQYSAGTVKDIAEGVATGKRYFSILSTSSNKVLLIYENVSGVAVYTGKSTIDSSTFPLRVGLKPALQAEDEDGKIFLYVDEDQIVHPAIGDIGERFSDLENNAGRITAVPGLTGVQGTDDDGKVFFFANEEKIMHPTITKIEDGIDRLGKSRLRLPAPDPILHKLAALAQIIHVILYGQSLSLGENTKVGLSTIPADNALMFNGGIISNNGKTDEENYKSLRPLESTATRETPAPGMAAMVAQLLMDEDGIDLPSLNQMFLMNCPGEGGRPLKDLAKGSTAYTRLITGIDYGNIRSNDLDKGYLHQVLYMMQGESSYDIGGGEDPELYPGIFYQMMIDIKADTLAETGVSRDPLVIWYQTSSHNRAGKTPGIAMKQIEMVEANENYAFSTPVYPLPYSNDLLHLNNVGSMVLGAYGGLAMKRAMWDGVKVHPMLLDSPVLVGNNSVLLPRKYPGTPLVLDANAFNPGNFGFSGATAALVNNPVLEVTLAGPDAIKVRFQSPVSAGDKVRYAWIGTADYGCGCLRDSQGDQIVFRHAGVVWPMHNWAPIQELTI